MDFLSTCGQRSTSPLTFSRSPCSWALLVALENLSQYIRLVMEGVVQAEAEMLIRAFRKCFQVHLKMLLKQIFRPNRCYVVNHIHLSELLWGAWHHRTEFSQRYDSSSLRAAAIFGTGHRFKEKICLFLPFQLSYPTKDWLPAQQAQCPLCQTED